MNNYFGENFKQLRKQRGWTQEQTAELLGVSSQAISKWETGNALPDISLLPVIANLYCISTDRLLGVDISAREDEICRLLGEAEKLCENKRCADAVILLRNALAQYPAEPKIMYQLAWSLTGTIREHPENLTEAISIYERLLDICTNTALRAKATRDLMYRYYTAGDEEKALKIATSLPGFEVCREYNLGRSNLLRGREFSEYLQNNIRIYAKAMKECLEYFLNDKIISREDMLPMTIESAKQKIELIDQIIK